jgi:hypothetical protein
MQYALLIYAAPGAPDDEAPFAGESVFDDWAEYTRAVKDTGVFLAAQQLDMVDTATTVRLRGGERLLSDGPFVETKEHLLGFFLVELPGLDAAIDWAARMPHVRRGSVEVRPVIQGTPWQAVLE